MREKVGDEEDRCLENHRSTLRRALGESIVALAKEGWRVHAIFPR
jgi:hypothetical protein